LTALRSCCGAAAAGWFFLEEILAGAKPKFQDAKHFTPGEELVVFKNYCTQWK